MAKTLFIVDDQCFSGLPETVRKRMLEETTRLFAFIPLRVETRKPALFPTMLDFTDSVVKLVDAEVDIGAAQNEIFRKEVRNISFSAKQKVKQVNIIFKSPDFAPSHPEMGGVGFHNKITKPLPGGTVISITETYGVASVEYAQSAVIEVYANYRKKQNIAHDERREIAKEGLARYFASSQALENTRELMEIELMDKPLPAWPQDHQYAVGEALGRIVAHEARHQYVLPHSKNGLGADGAIIWGNPDFATFTKSDQKTILGSIHKLRLHWQHANIHLETCPKGQPSPFI